MKNENAIPDIPADSMDILPLEKIYDIGQYLRGRDLVSFALSSKRNLGAVEVSLLRNQLLHAVIHHHLDRVTKLIEQNPDLNLIDNGTYQREKNPIVIACLDRRKDIYDILVAPFLADYADNQEELEFKRKLLEFHYLVMSGQRIAAERYLEKFDLDTKKALIFTRGPLGFSAIELSEIEHSDVQMRLRFYRQLTDSAEELKGQEAEIYRDNEHFPTDEEKWNAYCYRVMQNLDDDETKEKAAAHIKRIRDHLQLARQKQEFLEKYKAAYQQCIEWNEASEAGERPG